MSKRKRSDSTSWSKKLKIGSVATKIANVGGTIATGGWKNKGELKTVDLDTANYQFDTTGSVTPLNLIAQGTDNTTREGRQVVITSCHIRALIQPTQAASQPSLCRWLLVWDKQPNGALATVANILKQDSGSVSSSQNPLNLDNRERFIVLRDKGYSTGNQNLTATTAVADSTTYYVNEYVKINAKTTFSGTTAAIGSIATGALLLVTIGNRASPNAYLLGAGTRTRFTDN